MQSGDRVPPSETPKIAIITLPVDRWEELRDLRLTALKGEPTAFGEPYARADLRTPDEWRERLLSASSWLVFAEAGDRLVGLAGAFVGSDEPGTVDVVSVYVDPSVRGRGVGRALLTALIDRVAESIHPARFRLHVNDTNAPAIALYRSLGFQVVGVERDALQHDGVSYDELIMERAAQPQPG